MFVVGEDSPLTVILRFKIQSDPFYYPVIAGHVIAAIDSD